MTTDAMERSDSVSAMVSAQTQGVPVEDVSQRTEDARTFANPDGTWSTEVTSGPVRVQQEDGAWVDIDTTLEQNQAGEWVPRATAADVAFSDGGSTPFVTMAPTDGTSLGLTWPEVLPQPVVEGSTLTYRNVVANGDLVVQALPGGFSHEIVLHQAPIDPVDYHIPLELDGLSLVKESTGALSVRTTGGKEVASAPKPLMWDHEDGPAGEPENVAPLATTVDGTGQDAQMVLTPDMAMLQDPATQYPVTLDPTFNKQAYRDVWVQNADYTTGQVGSPELRAGTYDGGTHKARSFVDFNTDTLVGKQILSATLKLRNFSSNSCNRARIRVHAIQDAWNKDTLTWGNQPGFYSGVYEDFDLPYGATGCEANWATWNVLPIVERWADGRFDRNGFRIAAYDETNNSSWRRYRSTNYAVTTSYRPHLVVDYNNLPNTPGVPSISPVAGSTSTGLVTKSTSPKLTAEVSDPDGSKVRGYFEIRTSAGTLEWSGQSPLVASGSTAAVTLPVGELAHGMNYTVEVWAQDGSTQSTKSAKTTVKVDTQAPATPTIAATDHTNGAWNQSWPASNTFNFSSTAGDVTSFSYAQDSASWVTIPASNGGTASLPWNPPAGWHTLKIKAVDEAGNTSGTQTFSFGVPTPDLLSPVPQERSTSTFDIEATARGGATEAHMEWRLAGNTSAPWIDALEVRHASTGQPWTGSVTSVGSVSRVSELVWDAAAEEVPTPALVQVRICFSYADESVDCSIAREVYTVPSAFGSSFPSRDFGPGLLSLFTGELQLEATDFELPAAGLSLARSHLSLSGPNANPQARTFGPGWSTDLGSEASTPASLTVIDRTAQDGSITLQAPWGESYVYQQPGGGHEAQKTGEYNPVGETAAYEDTLNLSSGGGPEATHTLKLTEPDGTVTTWERMADGNWRIVQVDLPKDDAVTHYAYNGEGLLTWVFAPVENDLTCTPVLQDVGCRALNLSYSTVNGQTRMSSVDLVVYDPKPDANGIPQATPEGTGTNAAALTHTTVAAYEYTAEGLLRAAWDPRFGSGDLALKTMYTYTQAGGKTQVETVTPPGQAPWTFAYDQLGRVTTVRRPMPGGTDTSSWTVAYDVPTSGTGLPDLRPDTTMSWGQNAADAPVEGAAVWSPDRIPNENPTEDDYRNASLFYFTSTGATSNTAAFGAGAWQIDTTWYDEYGNATRYLTAGNRELAVTGASVDSAVEAERLSEITEYNEDGVRVEDKWGPTREVTLKDGSTIAGRDHTSFTYDNETTDPALLEGRPADGPPEGYDLLVEELHSVSDADRLVDIDQEATRYGYAPIVEGDGNGWTLGQPTSTRTLLDDGSWSVLRTRYDQDGQLLETQQPGASRDAMGRGQDPRSRRIEYYTADDSASNSACENRPEWAGLVCFSGPSGQPSTGSPLPTTWTTGYDYQLNPVRSEERSGGVTRIVVGSLDAVGRPEEKSVVINDASGSETMPTVHYTYDPETGLLESQYADSERTELQYDSWGREVSYMTDTNVPGQQNTAITTYDIAGRVKTFNDGKGLYTFSYDGIDANGAAEERGFPTSVDVGLPTGPDSFALAYGPDGELDEMQYPNGIRANWAYNSNGQETGLSYSQAGENILSFSADLDASGRIRVQTGPKSDQVFRYDRLGRLAEVEDTYEGTCSKRSYGFDADSNRRTFAETTAGCGASVANVEEASFDDADRITTSGYTYDNLGRTRTVPAVDTDQATAGDLHVDYHPNDMVASLSQSGVPSGTGAPVSLAQTFALDAQARIKKTTSLTDGNETLRTINQYATSSDVPAWVASTIDQGATWQWTRNVMTPDGQLGLVQSSSGESTIQLQNLHGDVVATMPNDSAATGIAQYAEFTEFGADRDPSVAREYGWLGSYQRSSGGLGGMVLMGARLYNPATGRFLSPDPIPNANATAYAYPADPINVTDLSGARPDPGNRVRRCNCVGARRPTGVVWAGPRSRWKLIKGESLPWRIVDAIQDLVSLGRYKIGKVWKQTRPINVQMKFCNRFRMWHWYHYRIGVQWRIKAVIEAAWGIIRKTGVGYWHGPYEGRRGL